MADLGAQFGQCALGDEVAVIDDTDALGHAFGDFEDVGRHDDGDAGRHFLFQHILHLSRRPRIETSRAARRG